MRTRTEGLLLFSSSTKKKDGKTRRLAECSTVQRQDSTGIRSIAATKDSSNEEGQVSRGKGDKPKTTTTKTTMSTLNRDVIQLLEVAHEQSLRLHLPDKPRLRQTT